MMDRKSVRVPMTAMFAVMDTNSVLMAQTRPTALEVSGNDGHYKLGLILEFCEK